MEGRAAESRSWAGRAMNIIVFRKIRKGTGPLERGATSSLAIHVDGPRRNDGEVSWRLCLLAATRGREERPGRSNRVSAFWSTDAFSPAFFGWHRRATALTGGGTTAWMRYGTFRAFKRGPTASIAVVRYRTLPRILWIRTPPGPPPRKAGEFSARGSEEGHVLPLRIDEKARAQERTFGNGRATTVLVFRRAKRERTFGSMRLRPWRFTRPGRALHAGEQQDSGEPPCRNSRVRGTARPQQQRSRMFSPAFFGWHRRATALTGGGTTAWMRYGTFRAFKRGPTASIAVVRYRTLPRILWIRTPPGPPPRKAGEFSARGSEDGHALPLRSDEKARAQERTSGNGRATTVIVFGRAKRERTFGNGRLPSWRMTLVGRALTHDRLRGDSASLPQLEGAGSCPAAATAFPHSGRLTCSVRPSSVGTVAPPRSREAASPCECVQYLSCV